MTWTHANEGKLSGDVGPTDVDGAIAIINGKYESAGLDTRVSNPVSINEDMFGTNLVLSIEGATYFSEKGGFGIGYGLDLEFPAFYSVEGSSRHVNGSKVVISPRITANYMHRFNDSIALEAGLGLAYSYQNGGVSGSLLVEKIASDASLVVNNPKSSEHILSIVGTVSAMYNITDMFALRAGVNFGFAVLDIISMEGTTDLRSLNPALSANEKASISANLSGFIFELTPFIGAAITY